MELQKPVEMTVDNPLYKYVEGEKKSRPVTNTEASMQRISTMHGRKHSFASNQPQFSKIPLKTRPNTRENTSNARFSNFSTLNKPST